MASPEDDLNSVVKQFLCCVPVKDLEWKNVIETLSWERQARFVSLTADNPLVRKYPLKSAYQRAFLKQFIDKLEASHIEVHDSVFDSYCALLAAADTSDVCYKHYTVATAKNDKNQSPVVITLKENSNIISQGTTGLCSWEASKALAEWCLAHRDRLVGKFILELGSGIGLTGLCVALSCAPATVHLTDCHPAVLRQLCDNVRLNTSSTLGEDDDVDTGINVARIDSKQDGILLLERTVSPATTVRVSNLNWEDVELLSDLRSKVDLVIAADVVYDPSVFGCLSNAIKYFLTGTNRGELCEVILACTERNTETLNDFLALLESIDLTVKEIDLAPKKHFAWASGTPVKLFSVRSTAA